MTANWKRLAWMAGAGATALFAREAMRAARSRGDVAGRAKGLESTILELGARLLQPRSPVDQFDTWLIGFHPLKETPRHQMEAHHFCRIVNDDFIQCLVFDSAAPNARLTGVEFIISEELFDQLDEYEKTLWHPHNYEVLSGQLVAPRLPGMAEDRLMRRLINSYGKTWHFWMNDDALPLGPACLAWSFNRDGQMDPESLVDRNRRYRIDPVDKGRRRERLAPLAHPQRGVDLLDRALGGRGKRPPGIQDSGNGAA